MTPEMRAYVCRRYRPCKPTYQWAYLKRKDIFKIKTSSFHLNDRLVGILYVASNGAIFKYNLATKYVDVILYHSYKK